MTPQHICKELNLNEKDIVNIYPYGSRVYGNHSEDADYDYVIVFKSAFLDNGAFKNNAISSADRKIQGSVYSRSGFQDAINKYDMAALECVYLDDDKVLKKVWPFKPPRIEKHSFIKNVITNTSNSQYRAVNRYKDGDIRMAKKGVYHSLRVLTFGLQIMEHGKIVDYGACNDLLDTIMLHDDFSPRKYITLFDELSAKLKSYK